MTDTSLMVWSPRDVKQLTTALQTAVGQPIALGDSVKVVVESVSPSKISLRILAPDEMSILRGELLGRPDLPVRLHQPRKRPVKQPGLSLTRKRGEWVRIGVSLFVGVSNIREGCVTLGFRSPPGTVVCSQEVWDDLCDPSRVA